MINFKIGCKIRKNEALGFLGRLKVLLNYVNPDYY